MAALMPQGKQQYFTAGGIPLVGGKVYTYAAGTTTPLATYTTAAASTPNTNPVILDSRGEASIFFSAANYKIVVKDSLDSTIWTQDNLVGDVLGSLALSTGSSLVGHLPSGAGAVATTVQSKLRESVSVLDFGPNTTPGTTDMTAIFALALTAASGKALLIPPGTYKITSVLSVPENTWVLGYGATLSCTTSQFNALLFANGGGVLGLTITGPASATYNANGIAIKCTGTNNAPSAPTFVNAPTVRDCTISNFGLYGVYFAYVNGGIVEGNTISGIGYAGVGGVSCNDTIVTKNKISTIGPGTAGDTYGVFIDRLNGTSETAEPRSYRCSITDNAISYSDSQGINTHGGVDFVISGNHIRGCNAGIWLTSSSISGAQALGPIRCIVTNNTLFGKTGSSSYGILVYGARTGVTIHDYAAGCVVSNNAVNGFGSLTSGTIPAVFLSGTKSLQVTGNVLRNSGAAGILLEFENIGFNISGNTITDPHSTSYATPSCIYIYSINNKGYIGGNTFQYNSAALDTYVAVKSIMSETAVSGFDIDIGRCAFQGLDATHLNLNLLTTTGIRYRGIVTDSGQGSITASSGVADGILDVTFAKRFPYVPIVTVSLAYPYNGGGRFPAIGVDRGVPASATGFRIYTTPSIEGVAWTATGTVNFDWTAS